MAQIPCVVSGELAISDLDAPTTTVVDGGILYLQGRLTGNLTIGPGGVAIVRGQVDGSVMNRGQLHLFGVILGNLDSRGG